MLDKAGPPSAKAQGLVCTFYSYKGGVGRSMALANVAAMFARWGKKVLVIDWDLEAPGLERYFGNRVRGSRQERDGLVDIVASYGESNPIDWRACLLSASIPQGTIVDILHAGREGETYLQRLRTIDWEKLFERGFGTFLEAMRTDWIDNYDYVLIDSRTGITDIGGICTILLPDYLVSLFTTNDQSVRGVRDTMKRARERQSDLPLKRRRMVIIPIAARDESATEYERAAQWRKRFASELAEFYADWIHKDETPETVLDYLKIPYLAYWSFGEQLPVLEEDPQNPKSLAYSYALIARLIHSRLDWTEVREGRKTTALQQQREAEVQAKLAEAAKARAEVQAQVQAELQAKEEETLARREALLWERYTKLARTARTNMLAYMLGCSLAVAAVALVGTFAVIQWDFKASTMPVKPTVSIFEFVALAVCGLLLAGSLQLFMRGSWTQRRLRNLESEQAAYQVRSGVYFSTSAATALLLFSERIEAIAAGDRVPGQPTSAGATPPFHPPTETVLRAGLPESAQPISMPASSIPPLSGPPGSAAYSTVPPPTATLPSIAEAGPVDVLLTYADGGIVRDWNREFLPLLRIWLSESLGRDVRFWDATQLPQGTNWQKTIGENLARAATVVVIATPRYFSSPWGAWEMQSLQGTPLSERIFAVALERSTISDAPDWLRSVRWTDFSDLAYVGEGFSKNERYVEFQDRVRKLASEMAAAMERSAPNGG